MAIKTDQVLEAAKQAANSKNYQSRQAATLLVKSASDLARADMIHLVESTQQKIIRELIKLKNEDLAKYNTASTLGKVDELLNKMKEEAGKSARVAVLASLILGRIESRSKQKNKSIVSAFNLSDIAQDKFNGLVDQLSANIAMVADATRLAVQAKLQRACVRAQTIKQLEKDRKIDVILPSLDAFKGLAIQNTDESKNVATGLKLATIEALLTNPMKAATELTAESNRRIESFRQEYLMTQREANLIRTETNKSDKNTDPALLGCINAQKELIQDLMENGIQAFQDKSGRNWSMSGYCNMLVRTNATQSENAGALYDDPEHDLYIIPTLHSKCPICSKYEGRVYSRSGTNPHYPPLSEAFGHINSLHEGNIDGMYLNIHPNCRHTLVKFFEANHTKGGIIRIQSKSTRPFDIDPRTKKEVEVYKEQERIKSVEQASKRRYKEFIQYIPAKELGTWEAFNHNYALKDNRYNELEKRYSEAKKASE